MPISSRGRLIAFAMLVYVVLVGASVFCLVEKRAALQFHSRDYNYFIEQAARLTDPRLSKHFTLNIEGYNYLGLQGIEGANNLIQAIHAEYFRYTYVILYGIFHQTLPIYIFYCLVFFLPILYFAVIPQPGKPDAWKQVALFISLFALFPATLNSVTADIRPRMLFIAAWMLVTLAVFFDRPFREKLLFFLLLLGIREEGILLGLVVILVNFLRMTGKPGRWKQTLIFGLLDTLAFFTFLAFMNYGHYTRVDLLFNPLRLVSRYITPHFWAAAAGVVLLALGMIYVWFKKRSRFVDFLLPVAYLAAVPLTISQLIGDATQWYSVQTAGAQLTAWQVYVDVISSSIASLVSYIVLLLVVLLWEYTRGLSRRLLTGFLVLLCVLFVVTDLYNIPGQIAGWRQQIPLTRLVWDFKENHDAYTTHVLLDYGTYQAFYNYENILVYNRLPVWLVSPDRRFYPDNKETLVGVIKESMQFAVVTRDSLADVLQLAQEAGRPASIVQSNDRYLILQLSQP